MSRRSTRRAAARRRSDRASRSRPLFGRTSLGPTLYRRPQYHRQLRLEPLEERRLLSITVTTLEDTIDFNDGLTSLREAIFAANTVPGDDTIEFAPVLTAGGPATILLTKGELKITDSLTISGPGAENFTIDPSLLSRIFLVDDGLTRLIDVSIHGLTLRAGRALDTNMEGLDRGGAISTRENLNISECVFAANTAQWYGGAIYATVGTLELTQCSLFGNQTLAGQSRGGAIYVERGIIHLTESIVSGSRAGFGGGINTFDADLTIESSTVANNGAKYYGGGINSGGIGRGGTIISRTSIIDNDARRGGGVSASGSFFNLEVIESSIRRNRGHLTGGGIEVSGNVRLGVRDCTVSGNTSQQGGGIWSTFRPTIEGTTVSGNSASVGSGIWLGLRGTDTARVIRSAVVENHNGGIYVSRIEGVGRLEVDHSIIAHNAWTWAASDDIQLSGATVDARYSIIGDVSGTNLAEAPLGLPDADGNYIGGPVHGVIDPLLGPLADNGGFELPDGSRILTHALLPGSPAINAGDLNAVAGEGGVPEFDQRDEPFGRIVGGRIDIGAFEYQTPAPINFLVDTLDDESDGDYSRGDLSLREAIELANGAKYGGVVDTIRFDPALTASGPATILLTNGELKITDSLTINGPGGDRLTIDASGNDPTPDANNADGTRVFDIDDGGETLQSIVLLAGLAVRGGDVDSAGGGIFAAESLTLTDVTINDNHASGGGGGLAISLTADAAATLIASTIRENSAKGIGGGMYLRHAGAGSVTVARSTFAANSTADTVADGGGVYLTVADGSVVLLENEFSANSTDGTSGTGGGLYLIARGGGSVQVEGNEFRENHPRGTGGEGGGAYIVHRGSGDLSVDANRFIANASRGTGAQGGGAYIAHSGSGDLTIGENLFSDNTTSGTVVYGGGVYAARFGSGQMTVSNNRFLGNATEGTSASGGGAYVTAGSTGNVVVTDNQLDGNQARGTSADGGGGYFRHTGSGDLLVEGNSFTANSILGTGANGGGLAVLRSGSGRADVHGNTAVGNLAGGTVSTGIGIFASAGSSGVVHLFGNTTTDNQLLTPDRRSFGGIGTSSSKGGTIYVHDNIAMRNFGGLAAQGSGTTFVSRNTLTNNDATGMILSATFMGGTIYSDHNLVTGNKSASSGGGIIVSVLTNGRVKVSDTLVADNEAAWYGGGIYTFMRSGGSIEIDRTLVRDNRLTGNDIGIESRGAGVYVRAEDGHFLLNNSTVSGNTALAGGGGFYVTTTTTDSAEIRNSTISGNSGTGNGGGLYLKGHVRANQVTITQNSGAAGGGVFVATGSLVSSGLLVAGNYAPIGNDLSGFLGASLDLHYSLVGNNSASGLDEAPVGAPDANGNLIGGGTFAKRIDPKLGPLEGSSGFELPDGSRILTHSLLPGSPAINAGGPAAVAGQGGVPLHDQRGVPFTRVYGGRIDIGAVEVIPAGFLPGDYCVDGVVDAMDYAAWRDSLGAIVTPGTGADGNGDGVVDERDFDVWKSNFGATAEAEQGARHGESLTGSSPRRIFDTEQGVVANAIVAAELPPAFTTTEYPAGTGGVSRHSTQPLDHATQPPALPGVRGRIAERARSNFLVPHDRVLEAWLSRRRFASRDDVLPPSTVRESDTSGVTAVDTAFDQLDTFSKHPRQSRGLPSPRVS